MHVFYSSQLRHKKTRAPVHFKQTFNAQFQFLFLDFENISMFHSFNFGQCFSSLAHSLSKSSTSSLPPSLKPIIL